MTDYEIRKAIDKTGSKGLAWDCMAIWAVKMISTLTATELVTVAQTAGVDVGEINLDWLEDETIRELEEHDSRITSRLVEKKKKDKWWHWMPDEV